jgi:uncharacterized protein
MTHTVPPGGPGWISLTTPDLSAAASFYGTLLGWRVTMDGNRAAATVDGGQVAALSSVDGPPAKWLTHIEVESVADTVRAVVAAGGSLVVAPATEGSGSVSAVVSDHAGTSFAVRETRGPSHGRGRQPGVFAWAELITDDTAASAAFYGEVFGWSLTEPEGPLGRREWRLGGVSVSGLLPRPPGMPTEIPAYWDVHFTVTDVRAAAGIATSTGGTQLMPPTSTEIGTIAVFLDPTGAVFTLLQFAQK